MTGNTSQDHAAVDLADDQSTDEDQHDSYDANKYDTELCATIWKSFKDYRGI